jgi:hypothetical protein
VILLLTFTVVFMADKGEWPKSYVIPSITLSLGCAGLLFWHVSDPARKIDAWTVTLLVVGFLPWLRTVFQSITFPGGGEVRYRELKHNVERQEDEIRALQFVVAHFLPDAELRVLERFAEPEPIELGSTSNELFTAISTLGGLGLIESIRENWTEEFNKGSKDLKALFRISDRGREYLELRKKTESSGP